jgi:hypothetical protein
MTHEMLELKGDDADIQSTRRRPLIFGAGSPRTVPRSTAFT